MGRYSVLFALACGSVGCHNLPAHKAAKAADCPTGETTITTPAPRVEVQVPEKVVVKAPAPTYEYADGCHQANCTGNHPGFCHARHRALCQQQACQPPMPQFAPQPGFGGVPFGNAPGFGSAPGFGGAPALMGGEVNERTSIGFMFDTIKIPLPWIRLKAIPRPTEVTFKSQLAPQQGFGNAVVMQSTGFGSVPMVPAGGFGGIPTGGFGGVPTMPNAGFGGVPVQQAGGQVVFMGNQTVPMQGLMPVQVNGLAQTANPGGTAGGGFGAAPGGSNDEVERLRQKLRECEELQRRLKELQTPTPPK